MAQVGQPMCEIKKSVRGVERCLWAPSLPLGPWWDQKCTSVQKVPNLHKTCPVRILKYEPRYVSSKATQSRLRTGGNMTHPLWVSLSKFEINLLQCETFSLFEGARVPCTVGPSLHPPPRNAGPTSSSAPQKSRPTLFFFPWPRVDAVNSEALLLLGARADLKSRGLTPEECPDPWEQKTYTPCSIFFWVGYMCLQIPFL